MRFRQLLFASISACLLLGCGSRPPVHHPAASAQPTAEYVTITPDESTYPARTPLQEPEPIGENEDVMASILAIPPGQ